MTINIPALLIFLLIGAIAGWLAGLVMKGRGFGVLGNMAVGIVGAVLGGSIFQFLGIHASGRVGTFVMAFVGAVVLVFLIKLIKRI
jgi:uncharacterized membrane protein YeaQ/YmgE (transglycosylase-associated protein family)